MANIRLKNIKFPGLDNTYTIPDEAPDYDATKTYAVGDMVIYNGGLYKCNTAISTAEAWTAAHWTATKLANEVTAQSEAIELIGNNFVGTATEYDKENTYYAQIAELEVGKTYKIGVTVGTSGQYGVHVCTATSAASVVAELFANQTQFVANVTQYVLYTPVGTGEIYIRLTTNTVSWSVSISEMADPINLERNAVKYHETVAISLGANKLSASSPVTLSTGWTGDYTNGFTHASGSSSSFYFGGGVQSGLKCIVEFDATGVDDSKLFVRIGNNPKVDVYNGSNHFVVGFIADGGVLMFTPTESYVGTITNITLKEVLESGGTQSTLTIKNVNHEQTTDDITGFWNVAIGADNTQDSSVNGSRNIGIGYASQHSLKSGTRNIGIGTFSMPFLVDGDRNIAIGADSIYSTKNYTNPHATDNVAIGYRAMGDGTDVKLNVAIGTKSMSESSETAASNTCVGAYAGVYATSGLTAVGESAGTRTNTRAANSVFVGRGCGVDNTGATSQNPKVVLNTVAVGYQVSVKASNEARFGNSDNIIYLAGKRIIFNDDNSVTWEEDT